MSIYKLERPSDRRREAIEALTRIDGDRRPQFRAMRRMMIRFLEGDDLRVKTVEAGYGLAHDLQKFMNLQARHSRQRLSESLRESARRLYF